MAVSISDVVLLSIVAFVRIQGGSLRIWPALACSGFGYFVAYTGAALVISDAIGAVTGSISSI
ncbi:hypothetical protein GCM10010271_70200 [Streptomyces kurssanovii]|nr:hypothetical protein GCM10010271_70200 [Streptomyces kurssanovii]